MRHNIGHPNTGSIRSKGKSEYQFHKSQFTISFVFSGKTWPDFLFTQRFKTPEKRFIHWYLWFCGTGICFSLWQWKIQLNIRKVKLKLDVT